MYPGIVGGALLLVLAGWAAFSEQACKQRWIQYVNGLAGFGVNALPFALTLTATRRRRQILAHGFPSE